MKRQEGFSLRIKRTEEEISQVLMRSQFFHSFEDTKNSQDHA
jgi:hypothetical protein